MKDHQYPTLTAGVLAVLRIYGHDHVRGREAPARHAQSTALQSRRLCAADPGEAGGRRGGTVRGQSVGRGF